MIGIDVGTTFSGVSYAILRPGRPPNIQAVTKYVLGLPSGSTDGADLVQVSRPDFCRRSEGAVGHLL